MKFRSKYAHTDTLGLLQVALAKITGRRQVVRFRHPRVPHPVYVRVPSSDVRLFKGIIVRGEYGYAPLPETAEAIIDAGANTGLATAFFAARYPRAKIVALEPDAGNFAMLQKNTKSCANVIAERAALWNEEKTLRLSNPGRGEWGFTVGETGEGETVPAVTVDGIMNRHNIGRVSILKVDIEGAELEVFANSPPWIERADSVIVETHDRFKPGSTDTVVSALIKDFHLSRHGENDFYIRRSLKTN